MALTGIEACVFDAYGTLLDVRSATARLSHELDGKAEQVGALWRQRQLEYTWLRSLMQRHGDFWAVTRDALDHAFGALGLRDDDDLKSRLMDAYLSLDAYPDVAPALAELHRAGLRTAILSNGTPAMLKAGVESLASVTAWTRCFPLKMSVFTNRTHRFTSLPVTGWGWSVTESASFPPMGGTSLVPPHSASRQSGSTASARKLTGCRGNHVWSCAVSMRSRRW